MPRTDRLLGRILGGTANANIRFTDLRALLLRFGFNERIRGDHHIFTRDAVVEIINLQLRSDGTAKPYQVRQVRSIIVKYKLAGERVE